MSWSLLRRLSGHDDRREAFGREEALVERSLSVPALAPEFLSEMQRRAQAPDAFSIGRTVEAPQQPVILERQGIVSDRHTVTLGASGSGKTFATLHLIEAVLRAALRGEDAPHVVIVDHKGELAALVRRLLARLAREHAGPRAEALIGALAVLDPFSTTALVPFQVLTPQRGVAPEVQAFEFVSVLNRMGSVELGHMQDDLANHLALLGITTARSVPALAELLQDPPALERAASACPLPQVAAFFRDVGSRPPTSLAGVRARFNRLLRLPATRLMLDAPGMVSFGSLLGAPLAVIDLGSPPLGCEDISRFWSGLVTLMLGRAIFARTERDARERVAVFVDEWQEGLLSGPDAAEQYERLLAMARSKGVAFHLISQSLAGAARVSPTLPRVVATNTATQSLFRMSPEDARAMSHIIPLTGRRRRPAPEPWERPSSSPFLDRHEERALIETELSSLPDRTFYLWDRRAPWPTVLVRSADMILDAEGRIPQELVRRLRDGAIAVPVGELGRPDDSLFVPIGVSARAATASQQVVAAVPQPRRARAQRATEPPAETLFIPVALAAAPLNTAAAPRPATRRRRRA